MPLPEGAARLVVVHGWADLVFMRAASLVIALEVQLHLADEPCVRFAAAKARVGRPVDTTPGSACMEPKTPAATPRPPLVFVSYSRKDEKWKTRLVPHLQSLAQAGVELMAWHDRRIDGGSQWYADIRHAMESAAAAVLLISADFLGSDFCVKQEARFLIERRAKLGMPLIPVLLRACDWEAHPWLSALQMLPRDGKCVVPNLTNRSDIVFREVAQTIHRHFRAIGASAADAS